MAEQNLSDLKIEQENSKSSLDIFLKWVDTFTLHGIPNVFRTNHLILKILWILAFLTSSSFCAYVVYESIANFMQFNVVTNIRINSENPITLPTISVCNLNGFVTEEGYKMVDDFVKMNFGIDLNDILSKEPNYTVLDPRYPLTQRIYEYTFVLSHVAKNSSIEQMKKFGFSFEKLLISCYFGLNPCDATDFTYYYDMLHGNCFRFNSGKFINGSATELKKITKTGKYNGLMLELFVGDDNDSRSLAMTSGAHIFIHNDTITPNEFEGISLSVGTSTNIAIYKTYIDKMKSPYSECTVDLDDNNSYDSELFRFIIQSNNTYRRSDCFNLCYQRKLINECKCYDGSFPNLNSNTQPCITRNQSFCQFMVYDSFTKKGFQELCQNECPLECYKTLYSYASSFTMYPSKPYANRLIKDPNIISRFSNQTELTHQRLRDNILALYVYFDSFEVMNIQESAQTDVPTLIAGIGGTLGLFLGISVLSLFEFVEITLEISLSKMKKSSKIQNQDQS